jgi:HEAT repeat protein
MLWWNLRQLNSQDPKTRAGAARKLGDSRAPQALTPLVAALRDKDKEVRKAAVEALGKIADPRATGALVETLEKNISLRPAAIAALGRSADPRAVAAVQQALASERDEGAWLSLVKAAAASGSPKTREALAEESRRRLEIARYRKTAVEALEHLGWQPADDRGRAILAVFREDWPAAVALGPAALEPLSRALPQVAAARALARLGDQRSAGALSAVLQRSSSEEQKLAALEALGTIGGLEAARALAAFVLVLEDPQCGLALAAFAALGQIQPEILQPGVSQLLDRTFTQLNTRRRAAMLDLLERFGGPGDLPALLDAAKDRDLAERAAVVLSRILPAAPGQVSQTD